MNQLSEVRLKTSVAIRKLQSEITKVEALEKSLLEFQSAIDRYEHKNSIKEKPQKKGFFAKLFAN